MEHSTDFSQQETCDNPIPSVRTGFSRLAKGAMQMGTFILLGLLIGAGAAYLNQSKNPAVTAAHVRLSFPGLERGEYPDKSSFQPDDLRRPELIALALKQQGLASTPEMVATVHDALSIEGLVSLQIEGDRDRTRGTGQPVQLFTPDEYAIRITPSTALGLNAAQRAGLLEGIVATYRSSFRNTYGELPANMGQAFKRLKAADLVEYELILNTEVKSISSFLTEQLKQAKSFRSTSTGLSYKDLIEQTELFAQIQLNETLGLIREYGLSRDRQLAMLKMQNELRLIGEREHLALAQEALVKDLLALTQVRSQDYVLGVTTDAAQTRSTAPLIDRGMVDSLLANDAKNFLVRQAMEAGLRVAEAQSDKLKITEMRDSMRTFVESNQANQTAAMTMVETAISSLEKNYDQLIDSIRKSQADFAQQNFGEAIRISRAPYTSSMLRPLAISGFFGAFFGFAFGAGLSLLGCYLIGGKRN